MNEKTPLLFQLPPSAYAGYAFSLNDHDLEKDDSKTHRFMPTPGSNALNAFILPAEKIRTEGIKFTRQDILRIFVAIVSTGAGFISAIQFLGMAEEAAGEDLYKSVTFEASAIWVNGVSNSFFSYPFFFPIAYSLYLRMGPTEFKNAIDMLKKHESGVLAALGRFLEDTLPFALATLTMAVFNYIFDKQSGGGELEALMSAFVGGLLLNYNSIKDLMKTIGSAVYSTLLSPPLNYLKSIYAPELLRKEHIEKLAYSVKELAQNNLTAMERQVLSLMQRNRTDTLNPLYEALDQSHAMEVLQELNNLKKDYIQNPASPWLERTSIILNLACSAASLFAFLYLIEDGVHKFFSLENDAVRWLLSSIIFGFSSALGIVVAVLIGKGLATLANDAYCGIQRNYQEAKKQAIPSSPLKSLFSKAWAAKGNPASWAEIVPSYPIAIKQNPRSMLIPLSTSYLFTLPSAAGGLYINTVILGRKVSQILWIPTFISIDLFNIYAQIFIAIMFQRAYVRAYGPPAHKQELRLEKFIEGIKDIINQTHPHRMVEIMANLLENDEMKPFFKIFVGNIQFSEFKGKTNLKALGINCEEDFESFIKGLYTRLLELDSNPPRGLVSGVSAKLLSKFSFLKEKPEEGRSLLPQTDRTKTVQRRS